MKKIYSSIVLLGAVMSIMACSNVIEKADDSKESTAPIIYASHEGSTKSSISVDGSGVGTIYWSPADDISIFYGASSPVLYTSTNIAPETTAAFTTSAIIGSTELASTNIWGLYPYNSSAICDGSSITTTLPATQYAIAGTFDDDLFLTVAHSDNTNLHFYNVCGGIKFSLSRDDITQITFEGNNNEDIAGDITVSFTAGLPSISVNSGVKRIVLTPKGGGCFTADTDYYIIALPMALNSGFTMKFHTETQIGTFIYTTKAVTIKRSIFSTKTDIDSYADFVSKQSIIQYTSTDGNIVTPYNVSDFDASIITNTYHNGIGVISFDNDITKIGEEAFYKCSTLASVIIPKGVTQINHAAFADCNNLSSVSLPEGFLSFGSGAFDCSGLTSIIIPEGVTQIGMMAFNLCEQLVSVSLPQGLIRICARGFDGCSSLNTISIPDTVTAIDQYGFSGCSGLSSIIIHATTPPSIKNSYVFSNTNNCPIYVPAESVDSYKTADKWSDLAERIFAIVE